MSLTSIMRSGFDKVIAENIPKPKDRFHGSSKCIAPPLTKNYSLVGTAFDYLLRCKLKFEHPDAKEGELIGLLSLKYINRKIKENGWVKLYYWNKETKGPEPIILGEDDLVTIKRVVKEYFAEKEKYLKTGVLTRRFAELTIKFARLDTVFRAMIYTDVDAPVDEKDIDDLFNLYKIVPDELTKIEGQYWLDPNFGMASFLVGGADVDLILGNTMIDIKTTKIMALDRYKWAQLVGYLMLADEAHSVHSFFPYIENIGIYFSRYGKLWLISADYVRNHPNYDEVKEKLLSTGIDYVSEKLTEVQEDNGSHEESSTEVPENNGSYEQSNITEKPENYAPSLIGTLEAPVNFELLYKTEAPHGLSNRITLAIRNIMKKLGWRK